MAVTKFKFDHSSSLKRSLIVFILIITLKLLYQSFTGGKPINPLNTQRKLNVHETFNSRLGSH